METKNLIWNEKGIYLISAVVLTLGLLAALSAVTVNLNNTTAMLAAAVLNSKSDWAVTHTFSFSAIGLSNGEKTIDIGGGGKFVTMTDIHYNVWLKGGGSLFSATDEKRIHWKAPQTGLYNQLEGSIEFTASTTGGISWINEPVKIELVQSSDSNDPTAGNVKVTIGAEVFEGTGTVVIS